jgi:hypothetical protein
MASRATSHAVIALGANVGDIPGAFARAIAELPLRGVRVCFKTNLPVHAVAMNMLVYALRKRLVAANMSAHGSGIPSWDSSCQLCGG